MYERINHPQSNGSFERFHATLMKMIRALNLETPEINPLLYV